MEFYFEGFDSPNGTYVPDVVFDVLAPQITEAELRVLLYIIRRTFGFKKNTDNISLKQMTEGIRTRDGRILDRGTGLSKSANARGVKGLIEKGIVVAVRNRSQERGDEATTYSLRFKEKPVSSKETRGVPAKGNGGVLLENTQYTVKQETEQQQHVVAQLIELKVEPEKARQLATRFDPDYIEQKIEFLVWKQETGQRGQPIGDPTAWLIRAIENDYQPPNTFKPRQERQRVAEQKAQELAMWEQRQQQQKAQEERHDQQRQAQVLARLYEHYQTTQAERDLWAQVLAALERTADPGTYQLWLSQTQALSLKHHTAVLAVPNRLVKGQLVNRLVPLILQTLKRLLHTSEELSIEVIALEHPPDQPS